MPVRCHSFGLKSRKCGALSCLELGGSANPELTQARNKSIPGLLQYLLLHQIVWYSTEGGYHHFDAFFPSISDRRSQYQSKPNPTCHVQEPPYCFWGKLMSRKSPKGSDPASVWIGEKIRPYVEGKSQHLNKQQIRLASALGLQKAPSMFFLIHQEFPKSHSPWWPPCSWWLETKPPQLLL